MRKLVSIILALTVLSGILCACATDSAGPEPEPKPKQMFVKVESSTYYDVVYHSETKVMYAVSDGSYNRGTFTLLVNADGTPMLWED